MHRHFVTLVIFMATLAPAARVAADASPPPRAPGSVPMVGTSACRSRDWRAARRAVELWCEGDTAVLRRYYSWSLARTKRRACADLRVAFARCDDVLRDRGLDGEDGHFVVVDYPGAEATYWQVSLKGDGRSFQVSAVN